MNSTNNHRFAAKRIMDLVITLFVAPVLLPVFAIVMLMVRIFLGAPTIFSQVRPGLNGASFKLYKFRTMTQERDVEGNLLPDEKRLVPFGKFLRKSSLDELPEFWNVLRGEMSLVGPRPLLVEYLDRYSPEQMRRHDAMPGITGWAQVNGRNAISWDEKFKLDVWYVDHQSTWLDLKILFLTVYKVFRREGITQQGHVTSGPFLGSKAAAAEEEQVRSRN
jgi:sugar transferase EpsL